MKNIKDAKTAKEKLINWLTEKVPSMKFKVDIIFHTQDGIKDLALQVTVDRMPDDLRDKEWQKEYNGFRLVVKK
jgi:hypothetical protein